ncbi:hypothetical protein HNQ68_003372 [Pseudochrobactrum saccharolyticum]|uniref:Uncharacterized protein n=1 Tax=Pseudochrobactrum saccharolyticum TaxID=354352 RepID=A0A7W8AM02_9HYPH|nr:hypothetical protein [Pseudochrobactrum saccharolyticum]KAB0539848.1 hypothetical protein F7P81_00025 [Pseudochrobactrum saccharolyticum]MBB5092809.1 hypothetical protein [Pseudochrobactrum saccharolyticum]
MRQELKIPHYAKPVLSRLRQGGALVRQSSTSEEATAKGNGYIYFTHPDGKTVGAASALWLIANEIVQPAGDDLFGGSQTYRVAHV